MDTNHPLHPRYRPSVGEMLSTANILGSAAFLGFALFYALYWLQHAHWPDWTLRSILSLGPIALEAKGVSILIDYFVTMPVIFPAWFLTTGLVFSYEWLSTRGIKPKRGKYRVIPSLLSSEGFQVTDGVEEYGWYGKEEDAQKVADAKNAEKEENASAKTRS
jgi:hypothetical protein